MDNRYLDPSFTTHEDDPVMKRSKRVTSTVQNIYLATVVFGLASFLFAFIDASWLTHKGVVDNESAAVVVGSISIVLFLILLILLIVALVKRKYVTDKLKQGLFHMFTASQSGYNPTVLQPEHVDKYTKMSNDINASPPQPVESPTQQNILPPISASSSSPDYDFLI